MIEFGPSFLAWMPGDLEYVGYGGASLSGIFLMVISIIVAWSVHYFFTHHVRLPEGLRAIFMVAAFFGTAWGIKWATDAQAPRWPQDIPKATTEEIAGNPINLNTATPKELRRLPGIGPVFADRIVQNRPYHSAEDVMLKVPKFGAAKWQDIRDYVAPFPASTKPKEPPPAPVSSAPALWPPTVQVKNDTDRWLRVLFMQKASHDLIVERMIGPRTQIEQPHLNQPSAYIAVMDGSAQICSGMYFQDLLGLTILEVQGKPKLLEVTR